MFALSIITLIAAGFGLVSYSNSARMAPRTQVAFAAVVPTAFVLGSLPMIAGGFAAMFWVGPMNIPLIAVCALVAGVIVSKQRMAAIIDRAAEQS